MWETIDKNMEEQRESQIGSNSMLLLIENEPLKSKKRELLANQQKTVWIGRRANLKLAVSVMADAAKI